MTLRLVSVPAPVRPLEAALGALSAFDPMSALLDVPGGPRVVTAGVLRRVPPGPGLAARAKAALADVAGDAHLVGALPFASPFREVTPEPPFDALAALGLVLPRLSYELGDGCATLTLCHADGDPPAHVLAAALAAIDRARPPGAGSLLGIAVRPLPAMRYQQMVEAALGAIGEGRLQKVVLARRTLVTAPRPFDPASALSRLTDEPNALRFCVRAGELAFVGASPERLVARTGLDVRTEALAGSARRSDDLVGDPKERAEHAHVADAIAERLGRLCDVLEVASTPEVRAVARGVHLRTPVRARLREPVHVLDLVSALHPTPAVAGTPNDVALALLSALEPVPRGLYAGPVGYCDARGDGDFWVALRSGLLAGAEAHLYAGAGIVRGSDPAREHAETEWKLRTMLHALGAADAPPRTSEAAPLLGGRP